MRIKQSDSGKILFKRRERRVKKAGKLLGAGRDFQDLADTIF